VLAGDRRDEHEPDDLLFGEELLLELAADRVEAGLQRMRHRSLM
jgi:hypothetical protein